ncbi:MAG: phosphate transport system substrate-binding protein [Candidatus Tokpelaia sp. JSC188]|nr:MAG: phosphate transport system substrate-binding protein [Candidatus Tokpelaia sp. JSC188]
MNRMICPVGMYLLSSIFFISGIASAREQIQIGGSSTVFPYAKIVAEAFGEIYPEYKIPVIESGGTGSGIKQFCHGIGDNTIDIANASRSMKQSELQLCFDSGVKSVEEVCIGYDGIAFATSIKSADWNFTPQDIYRALAVTVIVDGKMQPNLVKKWNEVNPNLPAWDIIAYIPGEKHGTREVFEEKLMLNGCKASGAFDALKAFGMDDKAAFAACVATRKDGKAIDVDGDYPETLARLVANRTTIGIVGLAFYENNADLLKIAAINDVLPSEQTISNGKYMLSRPLFFYVKKSHLDIISGLEEYVDFFLSDQMIGPDGPLVEYGLVAISKAERDAQRAAFKEGRTMVLR